MAGCLIVMGAGPPQKDGFRLVDMVVARVDATAITLSELVLETRLVLLQKGGPELARTATLKQPLLNAVLKSMVSRTLLLGEISRLKLRDVQEEDVRRRLRALRARFLSAKAYDRFLADLGFRPSVSRKVDSDATPFLRRTTRAELLVERFLKVRLEAADSPDEREISACYDANAAFFSGWAWTKARARVVEQLRVEHRAEGLRALLARLEARATIQYAASFEQADADASEPSAAGFSCGLESPSSAER